MFAIKNAWNKLWYNKGISIILILSIAAGFICPIYVLGEVHYVDKMYKDNLFHVDGTILVANANSKLIDEQMDKAISKETRAEEIAYECLYQTTASWKEDIIVAVGGVSPGFFDITPYTLVAGTMMEIGDSDERVCILKDNSRFVLKGVQVGDSVSVSGRDYKVVGIVRTTRVYGEIIIPYAFIEEIVGKNIVQHRLLLKSNEISNNTEVKEKLQKSGIENVYSIMSVEEEEQQIIKPSYQKNQQTWILAGFIVLCLALVSVWNLTIGRVLDERYMYGIRKAVGATDGKLMAETVLQNSVIVACAFILDVLILCLPLEQILPFSVDYGAEVVLQIIIMGILLVLVMSHISLIKMKKEICELVDGGKR